MIVDTMTKAELCKQLKDDLKWVCDRKEGIRAKYNKQLKNKHVQHLAVLGRTWYNTPNGNRVYTIWQKYYLGNDGKYAMAVPTIMHEYTTNLGSKRYIINTDNFNMIFTSHSMDRMKERLGKDIFAVFEDYCVKNDSNISIMTYDYNGSDNEYMSVIGDNVAFSKEGDWGFYVTTMISREQEYLNQLKQHAFLRERNTEMSAMTADFADKMCLSKGNNLLAKTA